MLKKVVAFAFAIQVTMGTLVAAQQPAANPPPLPPAQKGFRMGTMPEQMVISKITVADLQRSYDFYTNVLGMKLTTEGDMKLPGLPKPGEPEAAFTEVPLSFGGSMAEPMFVLIKRRGVKPTPETAQLAQLGFKVASTDKVVERAAQVGIKPTRPYTSGAGVIFMTDPDGYPLEIVQTAAYKTP